MCPVRNEDWIISLSLRALLMWVDAVVVLDHCSTDNTPDIINDVQLENPARIVWLREDSPVWEEMRHRQRLLDKARAIGGTHMVIVDADEVLTGDLLPGVGRVAPGPMGSRVWGIREMIENCPKDSTMELPWLCLRGSKDLVHRSGVWGEQNASMGFVDASGLHWSSEGRAGYDFHHRPPMGRGYLPYRPVPNRDSGLMHLQFVSDRRLRAKQALYKATEVIRWPGRETIDAINRKYNLSVYGVALPSVGAQLPLETIDCPARWWEPYGHLMQHYRPDAEPWQQAELHRLIAEHGSEFFRGLDFFGVA